MSLDVLLVNLHSVRNKWVLHPPLGLCYLGAMLEREGFTVEVLDANCPPELPGQLLIDEIERRAPAIAPDVSAAARPAPTAVVWAVH